MSTLKAIAHEQDFSAWALQNAELLRQGKFAECDVANIAEELDSMGRSVKRELASRLRVLLMHLLNRLEPNHDGVPKCRAMSLRPLPSTFTVKKPPALNSAYLLCVAE